MIKKISSLVWPILLILSLLPTPFAPVGPAAAETVWTDIATPAELTAIGQTANLAGNYRLVQHIDLAGYDNGDGKGWKPIGANWAPFTGKLDGNGYAIRNMTINRPNDNLVGLFGFAENAALTNLRFTNVQVNGQQDVGAIAGQLATSTLANSYAAGSVTGHMRVGLLVGYNAGSNVSDSYAQGRVQIDGAGGSSYGGLIGYSTGNSSGRIDRSYSTAAVESGSDSGGLIGQKLGAAAITSSYWDTETSGLSASSGGGTGKTTAEMKRKATYAGWDFHNTWSIVEESTYPLHRDDYLKVALAALTVQDTSTLTAQALDRTFSGDYGVYNTKVVNKTSQITVTGTPLSGTSTVSVNGGSGSEAVALTPGQNTVQITVTEPGGLGATYTLHVFRDEGSSLYPHRITTAGQLAKIGDSSEGYEMNHTYELEADIDLSGFGAGSGWQPIGNAATPFTGTFKGNNHTIANLTVNRPDTDHVGLFGYTSSGATVSNIALPGAELRGQHNVGGLIGMANDTAIGGISVQGAVYGDDGVGGLIGVGSGTLTIDESYSAAVVAGNTRTGGLIGSNTGGTATASFWDSETSGQASSAGGAGRTTQQMMQKSTFADSGWQFGSGNRWGIIEGTTYPMPYDRFGSVLLSGMTVTAPGTTVTLNRSFTDAHGLYTATLARPAAIAHISVTAADATGTQVSINGIAGSSADIDLSLGNNPVDIRVTDANGIWQGVYRLTVAVPVPRPSAVEVPADGTYGIARHLDFTIAYNSPVDVTGTPELPILINGIEKLALYTGKAAGQPEKLQFRYTVLSGDLDMDGIELGNAIAATPPATLTLLDDPVLLDLPVTLPSLSGVLIDGVQPSVTLTPSVTAPTSETVAVTILADGTGSALASLKWTAGVQDAVYFETAGTPVAGGTFPASLNGSYTVYAQDAAGNSMVKTIDITNIVTQAPTITLDYSPKTAVSTGVAISASASVSSSASGNTLTALRWASGERATADFAVPSFGTDVPPS
ncbi:cadherin-like beta sandwich domain-containing protein, partial [Paenibacillus hemerocallicola]